MRIPSVKLLLPLTTPMTTPMTREPLLQNLKPGQILQGTVLTENQNGKVQLRIGITRLIAQTQLSVRPGQTLTLQVNKAGDLPELKLLTLPTLQKLQAKALMAVLPRQNSISPLLDKLIHTTSKSGNINPLPEVTQASKSLLGKILSTEHPEFRVQLKQALRNSGLFTEVRLLSRHTDSSDLKLNLMRLYHLLQTSLPQQMSARQSGALAHNQPHTEATPPDTRVKFLNSLLKQLDGALARMQTNQLASLPQEDPTRQTWQIELPILHENKIDLFQILINKDQASTSDPEASVWTLMLQMNLQTLGPMRIQLTLQGHAISTVIWAEQRKTINLVKTHLQVLSKALETAGLEIKKLETFQARIEERDPMPKDISLLSEKA